MSAVELRNKIQDAALHLLWSQWSKLGVASHVSGAADQYVIDPEALLLATSYFGRYDQRLFDCMIDWLQINGRFLNIQRLRSLSAKVDFEHRTVICSIGANLQSNENKLKWKKLLQDWMPDHITAAELLFKNTPWTGQSQDKIAAQYGFLRNEYIDGKKATAFPVNPATTLLRLRGMFGVSARAEVLAVLLTQPRSTNQSIVEKSGFSWKSIQDILFELSASCLVEYTNSKRSREYFINMQAMTAAQELFFPKGTTKIEFPNWSSFYNGIVSLHEFLTNPKMEQISELTLHTLLDDIFDNKLKTMFAASELLNLEHISTQNLSMLSDICGL